MTFGWGGWRPGAGRKPSKRRDKRVLHRARPEISARHPAHVTLRVHRELTSLRTKQRVQVLRRAFIASTQRGDLRVCDWSIQGNHVHLVVEANDKRSLGRGLQGVCVRVARGLNALMGRKGAVFTERYHVRVLTTPREVRNARAYVLNNHRRHAAQMGRRLAAGYVDPCSSWAWFDGWRDLPAWAQRTALGERVGPPPVASPTSWLMRVGWRKHGLVRVDEVPASCPR